MKKFIKEFQAFIKKGNVLDLAVGVIIGGAFGKIVSSLVSDILTPFIVLAVGKASLSELVFTLRAAVVENGEVVTAALTINWGTFLQTILDFLVIALVIFTILRAIVRAKSVSEKFAENAKNIIHKHTPSWATKSDDEMQAVDKEQSEPEAESIEESPKEDSLILEPQADSLKKIESLLAQIRDNLNKN